MADEELFAADGSKTGSTALLTLVVLGVVGSIAMLVPAFIVPEMVGSPLIYFGTLAASIGLGVWVFKKDKARIRLVRRDGELRLTLDGPTTKIDVAAPAQFDYWVSFYAFPLKHGGGEAVVYSVAFTRIGLGLRLMAGPRGSEPADWPMRDRPISEGDDVFLCPGIIDLVRKMKGTGV